MKSNFSPSTDGTAGFLVLICCVQSRPSCQEHLVLLVRHLVPHLVRHPGQHPHRVTKDALSKDHDASPEQLPEPVARVLVLARRDQQEISSDQDSKHAVYAAGTVTVNNIVSLQCAVKLKLCKFNLCAKNIRFAILDKHHNHTQ